MGGEAETQKNSDLRARRQLGPGKSVECRRETRIQVEIVADQRVFRILGDTTGDDSISMRLRGNSTAAPGN